ncbi:unnamed protein product [Effrenium voratum]|nr:unnamed protein product [Effrenium voratum]
MTEATTARVCGLEYDGVAFACRPEQQEALVEQLEKKDRRLVRAYLSKGVEGIDRLVASILPHHILEGRLVRECMETAYFCPESRQWQLENPARADELLAEYSAQVLFKCLPETWKGLPPASMYRREAMRSVVKALYDRSFQSRLDGEDYRRLVMTSDGFLIDHPSLEAVRVLYSCCKNMSTTLFLLKSAAHRLCGSTGLEEFNIFLGDGKNGKSWWVDQLKAVFGSYGSVVTESDMLTRRFNSQQRGRSSEPGTCSAIWCSLGPNLVYSRLNLEMDGGVDRRLVVAEWPFRFCAQPRAPHEREVLVDHKEREKLQANCTGLLYVLLKVISVFHKVSDTVVRSWPVSVAQGTRAYMGNESADFVWSSFVETWEIASKPAVECSNYATVMEDWLSFCRNKSFGRTEALKHFRSVTARHKRCGKYVAKFVGENRCFKHAKPLPLL